MNESILGVEGQQICVDGMVDEKGVKYLGSAVFHEGRWTALANVGGALCRVEVRLSSGAPSQPLQPPVSPRGIPLAREFSVGPRTRRILTVELSSKWYQLFILELDGRVSPIDILTQNLCPHGCPGAVDHDPNPCWVESWALESDLEVEPLAMEMIVGRWVMEDHSLCSSVKS